MSDNLPSIILPPGKWIDLYSITGINQDARLIVQNIGSSDVYLSSSLNQPELDSDAYQAVQPNNFPMINDKADTHAWAFSPNQNAKISVRSI